jgi:hypothetical protein
MNYAVEAGEFKNMFGNSSRDGDWPMAALAVTK